MLPLITPPQSTPVLDGAAFARAWYLYQQNLQQWAAAGGVMAQYGTHAKRLRTPASKAPDGGLWIETDTGLVYQAQTADSLPSWSCISGTQQIPLTLSIALTNIDAPASGALELVYFLLQDGTGGRGVHWRTGFSYAADSLADAAANTLAIFRWILNRATGLYVPSAQPIVGVSP